ncbi:hypothetical protein [Paenibacillus sp. MBLB4367]|uniref:hypothetical protein n=1 Tax=Paenibacillus sp. MBLB4367 TaxID=3384767 RepID=UPI0039082F64
MITDEELDRFRLDNTKVRIIRDAEEANDVKGFVVAWDEKTVLIRKQNRRVLKLDRSYTYKPLGEPR